jgi:LysR family transcriptional regulator of gallate degradation
MPEVLTRQPQIPDETEPYVANARAEPIKADQFTAPRQLLVFQITARLNSVSKAAAAMNMSQPAVTQAIARLEKLAGATLFDRRQTGCYLTPAGGIFQIRVDRLIAQIGNALCPPQADIAGAGKAGATRLWRLTAAQIRGLIAIAECSSFVEAASLLGISKASLRRTNRELESQQQHALFEHTASGPALTMAGREMARSFKLASSEIDYAIEEIALARGEAAARIRIGVLPQAPILTLTAALKGLADCYPGLRVTISEGPYNRLLADLRSGQIDILFGVLRRPDWADDVREEVLLRDPYVVAARRGHPLSRKRHVAIEDLANFDWVVPEAGTPRRRAFDELFESLAVRPIVAVETSSPTIQQAIIATSDRLTLVPRREVSLDQSFCPLIALRVVSKLVRRPDGIATRADWHPTIVQQRFLALLRACAHAPEPTAFEKQVNGG